ncbi:MAG: hypothetical protein ACRDJX_08770 [Solirubrobacteraceae bacterium]
MADSPGGYPAAVVSTTAQNRAASDPHFDAAIAEDVVVMGEIVRAKIMSTPHLTTDATERACGEHYYPLLLASFRKKHKGVQLVTQEDVGFGVSLHSEDQEDPSGDKIEWAVIRRTLRFDWSLPRGLLIETQELADEARRWLRNPSERRDVLGRLYNVMTQIGATIGRENRLCPEGQDESANPSDRIERDVAIIRKQLDGAREQFRGDTERAAQFRYAKGMVVGAAFTLVLCGVIAGVLALEHVRVINAVGIGAGALGAFVSVLERMTRGKLDINAQSGDRMLTAFGALRPMVGGIFGFVIYLIIRAELISVFVLPKHNATALAYVAVFAFVAGFNERFAQDVLANASNARREDS